MWSQLVPKRFGKRDITLMFKRYVIIGAKKTIDRLS